jgi:hypothetical protein
MNTQQTRESDQRNAAQEFQHRSAEVNAAIAAFTKSNGRSPSDSEVLDLIRETRPDKAEAFELPPFAQDKVREYYEALFFIGLRFLLFYLAFLVGFLGLGTAIAAWFGWISLPF